MADLGRPPKYENKEDLQKKVDEYFDQLEETAHGTITGLALYLGFESRQSFYDYEGKESFSYTIRRARLRIENVYENGLMKQGVQTGCIFALKNFGWTDKPAGEDDNETLTKFVEALKLVK